MSTTINVRIETRKTDPFECEATDVIAALDQYIEERLGYDIGFAISEVTWRVIKAAVIDSIDDDPTIISRTVELVNGLCKNGFCKITKVLSGYTLDFPVVHLSTPVVSLSGTTASWTAVPNATGYVYKINGGVETPTTETSVKLEPRDTLVVKAVGSRNGYLDSCYSVSVQASEQAE